MNSPKSSVTTVVVLVATLLLLSMLPVCNAAPTAGDRQIPDNVPIRLATLEWRPYVGSDLPEQGYVAALARAVFAEQGIPLQIDFHPWERGLYLARAGEVDGLMPEYFDASRLADFTFSDPFPGGPLVLFKRREDAIAFSVDPSVDQDAALRSLLDKRFGVVRAYVNTPALDAADYLLKEEFSDDAANLRALVRGDIDLAVIDRRVADYLIRNHYPDYAERIEAMTPAIGELPLYIGFSRKSRRLDEALTAFNRGLEALRADGRLEALHRRYVVKPHDAE
ncbi:MAG: transporter substrate-binding domain-containing protein [Xanthomonadales bacterium]|nr:transporter substrate-binding domain-containing protein [Xanthomonadales bacterium]